MSRTETEFLRPCKYDVYTRSSLIASWHDFRRYAFTIREHINDVHLQEIRRLY